MPKNRLAQERSPYLRQHDDNPVDWYPWGDEALERARREDKPILLSVGYSACHWCHVMAHESFEDEGIAALMNRDFISIKVDREERPDVDQLYQGVVQLMGQGGGWPLTVFLTPGLRPFFGGTYFPPSDRYGRPGFPRLLEALADAWKNRRKEIDEQAAQFEGGLGELATYGLEAPASTLEANDVVQAGQTLAREIDQVNGGFGGAPKFPNPMNVALLLRAWRRSGEGELRDAALLTLEQMAVAGIYDQLGGGFHRYSVDRYWRVPHFEKMLYDNAQLLHLYSEGQQVAPKPLFAKVVEETVAYLGREMTDTGGGLYASQDADSEGEEGKFFVWTPEELDRVLSKELAALAKAYFAVTPAGNFEHGQTVLEARQPIMDVAKSLGREPREVASQLAEVRRKLFEVREQRVKPGRDDKILAGWNGLAIRGLAFASRVFRRPEWAEQARRAADFVLTKMLVGDKLLRSAGSQIDGFLEDYGDVAAGLVALYQATFEPKYLEAADRLARAAVTRFWDEKTSAYRVAAAGAKDLVVTPFALHDNAYPSGASSLTEAQVALAALTGDRAHLDQAAKYLEKLREPMLRNPFGYGHLWLAADAFLDGAAEVTLVMPPAATGPWLDALAKTYAPTIALAQLEAGRVPKVLEGAAEGRVTVNGQPTAYLCRNFACEPPVTSPQLLQERLTNRSR